jgi:Family of unknown function (DUF6152)
MTNNVTKAIGRTLVVVGLAAGMTGVALAHHSYSAFDMVGTKTLTGTVTKFDWSNPHSWIWIDVKNEQGVVETWGIEAMSPNFLARRGWTRTTLKPGDVITMTIHPLRGNEKGGSFLSGTKANGEALVNGGAITEP